MRTLLVIKNRTLNLSRFVNVEVYCNASGRLCKQTRSLLLQKGISFTEHRIDKDKQLSEAMFNRCKEKTVPQIFINKIHIGGYDDLVQLNNENKLDALLGLTADCDKPDSGNNLRRKTIIVGN